jgi:hypothetical protein
MPSSVIGDKDVIGIIEMHHAIMTPTLAPSPSKVSCLSMA